MKVKDARKNPNLIPTDLIYSTKPLVITNNNIVVWAGNKDDFIQSIKIGYYDECTLEVREFDLYMNDNSKIVEEDIEISMKDLNILQKYLYNRVSYYKFFEAMKTVYSDESYIEPLWEQFKINQINFLTSRTETDVLQYFISEINRTNYKG